MNLVQLIKKLNELNNDSKNSNKIIKVSIEYNGQYFEIEPKKVLEVDNHIEIE